MVDKFEIANALRETGMLLTASGGNPYKARAYLNGARSIESLQQDINDIIKEDRLTEIPGIGPSIAKVIKEIVEEGKSHLLSNLREEIPPGIIELQRIRGVTLKRAQQLHTALGITSVEELKDACLKGMVRNIKGFGAKTEKTILDGINFYENQTHQIRLIDALEIADQFLSHVRSNDNDVHLAGTMRRWHEVVDNIKMVARSTNRSKLSKLFQTFPLVTKVEESSDDYIRVRLTDGITAELFISESVPTKMLEVTGSHEHFNHLQRIAKEKGFELTGEYLKKDGSNLKVKDEREVYKTIGLSFVPAEMREDDGEVELASKSNFNDLISIEDIQGMTHCHTTYSDGKNSVEEMARAAEKLGMKYLTITDHSPLAHYAGGLVIDELKKQWDEIDRVQELVNIKLLKGTESDILADGALDYPDHILEKFNIIIASVHSRFKLDRKQMTERLLNCMKNKHFKVWGHPLGRLVLRREPIDCDLDKVLDAIAESRAAIEINGDPYRLDLPAEHIKEARKRGIKFIISTDAHSIHDYGSLEFGIHQARRGGMRKQEVLNTWALDDFREAVRPR